MFIDYTKVGIKPFICSSHPARISAGLVAMWPSVFDGFPHIL